MPDSLEHYLDIVKQHKVLLEEKFGVLKIGIFGSYARHQQEIDSDLDILVELDKHFLTFDNYMDLRFFLEESLNKKVDLGIIGSIRKEIMDHISRETVYA